MWICIKTEKGVVAKAPNSFINPASLSHVFVGSILYENGLSERSVFQILTGPNGKVFRRYPVQMRNDALSILGVFYEFDLKQGIFLTTPKQGRFSDSPLLSTDQFPSETDTVEICTILVSQFKQKIAVKERIFPIFHQSNLSVEQQRILYETSLRPVAGSKPFGVYLNDLKEQYSDLYPQIILASVVNRRDSGVQLKNSDVDLVFLESMSLCRAYLAPNVINQFMAAFFCEPSGYHPTVGSVFEYFKQCLLEELKQYNIIPASESLLQYSENTCQVKLGSRHDFGDEALSIPQGLDGVEALLFDYISCVITLMQRDYGLAIQESINQHFAMDKFKGVSFKLALSKIALTLIYQYHFNDMSKMPIEYIDALANLQAAGYAQYYKQESFYYAMQRVLETLLMDEEFCSHYLAEDDSELRFEWINKMTVEKSPLSILFITSFVHFGVNFDDSCIKSALWHPKPWSLLALLNHLYLHKHCDVALMRTILQYNEPTELIAAWQIVTQLGFFDETFETLLTSKYPLYTSQLIQRLYDAGVLQNRSICEHVFSQLNYSVFSCEVARLADGGRLNSESINALLQQAEFHREDVFSSQREFFFNPRRRAREPSPLIEPTQPAYADSDTSTLDVEYEEGHNQTSWRIES